MLIVKANMAMPWKDVERSSDVLDQLLHYPSIYTTVPACRPIGALLL